jgi:sigma-E factor negative regulatory protein RseB
MRTDRPRALIDQAARKAGARFAALSMLLAVGVAIAAEPQEWLERMNKALTTRNYIGVFTHNQAGRVETLRIIHRVRGGDVSERLLSLDGPGREFIRQGDELTCYFPDKRVVLVERRAPDVDGLLLGALPPVDKTDSVGYEIRGGERERLLGRTTRLVALQPRDQYRYGYRLWIDEQTSMPLKTQLCGASGEVIEQIVFSNIDLPERIPDSMFKPLVDASNYRWLRADRQIVTTSTPALWEAMKLPPGFRMTTRSAQALPGSSEPVAHLVFSDGIASVSVFVEAQKANAETTEGPARVGSSSAFSTVVDGHQVTAVGEVPPTTVEFIANQVKAAKSSPATQGLGLAPAAPRRK